MAGITVRKGIFEVEEVLPVVVVAIWFCATANSDNVKSATD